MAIVCTGSIIFYYLNSPPLAHKQFFLLPSFFCESRQNFFTRLQNAIMHLRQREKRECKEETFDEARRA